MIKQTIVTVLILVLLAPLNAGASAWMSQSSSMTNDVELAMSPMHMPDHDHETMLRTAGKPSTMDTHDHSPEDCDEYCMNCVNHCSSTAISSSLIEIFELNHEFETTITSDILSRAYLLYRPPIRA